MCPKFRLKNIIREGALSLVYVYISLTSGRPDPSSFKTSTKITTDILPTERNYSMKGVSYDCPKYCKHGIANEWKF
jgi:hypothetical protein